MSSSDDMDIPTGGSGGDDELRQKMLQYVVFPYGINAFSLFYYFQSSPTLLVLVPLGILNLGAFTLATYTLLTGRFPDQ